MNVSQETVLDLMNNTGENIFLTGDAGTGKSYVTNEWLSSLDRSKVAVCAPTGIAALNINGETLHRMFNIPFSIVDLEYQATVQARKMKATKRRYLQEIEALLIDEVSMARSDVMNFVSAALKVIREDNKPFGGVRLIAVGDPFQLPPVVQKHEKDRIPYPWFFQSDAWISANPSICNLTEIYRQKDDLEFAEILQRIRWGRTTKSDLVKINKQFSVTPKKDKVVVACLNRTVDQINSDNLARIDSKMYSSEMEYYNYVDNFDISKSVPAPVELYIKVGAKVMLLSNNSTSDGSWVNGSIGHITKIETDAIDSDKIDHVIVTLTDGQVVKVKRTTWKSEESSMGDKGIITTVMGTATQFPIKLGYAVTVHKSQGMTFSNMHFHCDYLFERGQAYVALSRAMSLDGLSLSRSLKPYMIMTDPQVIKYMNSKVEKG